MFEPLPRGVNLPTFPWDTLADAKRVASQHPDGIVDLSIGTPVDPTPELIQEALIANADAPGYPPVVGTNEVVEAVAEWARSRNISVLDGASAGVASPAGAKAIPTIGSKEMVAWLPLMLGVRPGDRVLFPECAYPTYDIGARLAGAEPVAVGDDPASWPDAAMVWLNSPGNPNGHVLDVEQLRAIVAWARERNAVVASDECYAALNWDPALIESGGVPSLLSDDVCDGDPSNLLVLYSLSKQSNMAGYRAGIMLGDESLMDAAIAVRKHAGMMVSTPVMAAMVAALRDSVSAFENPAEGVAGELAGYAGGGAGELAGYASGGAGELSRLAGGVAGELVEKAGGAAGVNSAGRCSTAVAEDVDTGQTVQQASTSLDPERRPSHVSIQRSLYAKRRAKLLKAFASIGLVNDPKSRAGLYLWLRDENNETDALEMVGRLAELGILVAPGNFYGPGNEKFIRVSLSGHDERIDAAVERMSGMGFLFPAK